MKYLLSGTLIATLALSTAAMAFGPGFNNNWATNQQAQLQSNTQTNGSTWQRGQGRRMGQNQAKQQGRGQGRGMGFNQQGTQQSANRGNRTGEPIFVDGWDTDEDRIVTLKEAEERRVDLFDALDDNEDGKIVKSEFDTFLNDQKMPPEEATNGQHGLFGMSLAFNDADKDGSVTKAEFLAQTKVWLDGMDRNQDGKVSDDDFGPRNGQVANNTQGRGMGRGNGQGRGMGRWQQQQPQQ